MTDDEPISGPAALDPLMERASALTRALVVYEIIERAVGVLMALHQLTEVQSRAILLGEADRRHLGADLVASEVIAHHTGP